MHVLVFGRTLPTKKTGSLGLFEFEQAGVLAAYAKVGYIFLETDSILTTRKIRKINENYRGIDTVGYYFPLGRSLGSLYSQVRFKLFKKLFREYRAAYGKPDLIHVHFPTMILTDEIIDFIREQGIELVLTEHWSWIKEKKISEEQAAVLKHAVSAAKTTICVSEDLKHSIQELTGKEGGEKLRVIANMISDEFFQPYEREKKQDDDFVFTYIGSLKELKRVDLLIRSFQDLFQNKQAVKLNIVGDGPERKTLEGLVSRDCKDQVKFRGSLPKDQVFEVLTGTDVYVSASHYESFGVPFIEALAMGIPVIASSNMPIVIYLDDSKGVIFEDGNREDLSRKMNYMYENIDNFEHQQVRSGIFEQFNGDQLARKLMAIYEA
ncbi:MAG: glycosyltransferase family 4 protein [Clostridiaceae bacterium]|jgi:glycosyltransferase involved in cell wall biosynthesis|nr:glycosyltransferase family 4 protein [Clostridiaceae bacterium]